MKKFVKSCLTWTGCLIAIFIIYALVLPANAENEVELSGLHILIALIIPTFIVWPKEKKKQRIFDSTIGSSESKFLPLGVYENQIIIERKKQIAGSAVAHTVFLDGKLIGKIKSGKKMIIDTFPGRHIVLVKGVWKQADSLDFVVSYNQKTTYVFDQLDLWKSNIKLSLLKCEYDEVQKASIIIPRQEISETDIEFEASRPLISQIDATKYWIKGNLDLLETDLVETSYAEVCCEKCARYRNRIFSLTGADKRFPKIPEDFDSSCCSISLFPFVWGVSEPGFSCDDPIEYSNRPFVDDRTDDEKERYKNWRKKIKSSTSSDTKATPDPVQVKDRDPMEIIVLMERRFEEQYKFAYKHLLNLQDCQKMYAQTVKEFECLELPLMAQVRFEQLCAEYKEKFNITNPFVVIDAMDGHSFEEWCAELLRKSGFTDVEVTPGSGDQGVDVIAVKDGVRYAIQCKCYSSDLGNKPVQEVHTGKSIYRCQVGVVMTNRYFTSGAKEAADATGVLLWGRDKLEEMIEKAEHTQSVL